MIPSTSGESARKTFPHENIRTRLFQTKISRDVSFSWSDYVMLIDRFKLD